ncbi:MAG: sn-glycerol-3-phosphate ABC transporter ATP-binding protein UgpC [Firmicutes bacterium]|nr:sn-glycerol-3-phosphate ABC transporter ATP-binding protein UgpC [Bacillota bacterium]
MARVVLENVTKRFGSVVAVNNASLEIKDKEFVVLVGPSGCGKSTTLRMIAGLEEISEGNIYIGDQLVNDIPPKDRDIAMVFQNYALYPHMDVYNNMAFGLKLRKVPKDEIDARVRQAAKMLGIEELLGRRPKALSGGQRQRVAVGRAIVREPQVFLMDEPLSNLDAKLRVQMRTELVKLHQRLQTTMIYVTHDQTEAMTMGDRIVVMKDAVIQQVGEPLEIYDNPDNVFVAGFIGSPAMNFMEARVGYDEGFYLEVDCHKLKVPPEVEARLASLGDYKDRKVIFGIRPEDIKDEPESFGEGCSINAVVDVTEPMGSEIYVYFTLGNAELVARVPATSGVKAGKSHPFSFNMNKLHVFDIETEKAIR